MPKGSNEVARNSKEGDKRSNEMIKRASDSGDRQLKRYKTDTKLNQRKNKLYNSRQIRTSNNDPAFKDGVLQVPEFLKARQFEIQELEKLQLRSKYSSSTRIFQSLPRVLRRRAASHNVKRVPRRMRLRALREMKLNQEANTGPGKPDRKSKVLGKDLYHLKMDKKYLRIVARLNLAKFGVDPSKSELNLRQKMKILTAKIKEIETQKLEKVLSTSTPEQSKLIKARIYLNNSLGSYDNSALDTLLPKPRGGPKYHKRQKNFVWLPTHIWHTKRAHLIKRWGFQIPLKPTQKCFKSTHRKSISEGALIMDTSYYGTLILQSSEQEDLDTLILKVTNNTFKGSKKLLEKFVYIESQDKTNKVVGKAQLFAYSHDHESKIMIRLHPSIYEEFFTYLQNIKSDKVTLVDCRYAIGSIDLVGPMSLLSLSQVLDPSTMENDTNLAIGEKLKALSSLQDLNLMSVGTVVSLFVNDPRLTTKPVKVNPNKYKEDPLDLIVDLSHNGGVNPESIDSILSFDGRFESYKNQPTVKMLSLRRAKLLPGLNKLTKAKDDPSIPVLIFKKDPLSYSVLLPWYWILPFWVQLNKISHLSIGGLKQFQQINFENSQLTYPNDYPFLIKGYIENFVNGNEGYQKWKSIQPGKRFNYSKLDLNNNDDIFGKGEVGFPFSCDWNFLRLLRLGINKITNDQDSKFEVSNWSPNFQRKLVNLNDVYEFIKDLKSLQEEKLLHGDLLLESPVELYSHASDETKLAIAPISFTLVSRGHPKDNARIYKIPESELSKWLDTESSRKLNNKKDFSMSPQCPHADQLIGFATAATFNLSKGKGSGVGYVDLQFADSKYLLIRNVGESKLRLAISKTISI